MVAGTGQNFSFDFTTPKVEAFPTHVVINGIEVQVTPVFYAYWRFAAERQRIFFRRLRGHNDRLTNDPVLTAFKFTNAYRASDRVSQYLIREVIYRDDLPSDETNVFFRVLLFKLFNRIDTWQALERELGQIIWQTFDVQRADAVLMERMTRGLRNYSAAYIMPSPPFGHKRKHRNHLDLISMLIDEQLPQRMADTRRMADAYALLLEAPSLGPFLAYQFTTDLNYSHILNFAEDEFVVAGPGALDGIEKCFVGLHHLSSADVIRYMQENQRWHFDEQGINFEDLWGRALQLIDCQNLFCEISKYARVAFPTIEGVSGRTRIKQKFVPAGPVDRPHYPPKWGLAEAIADKLSA